MQTKTINLHEALSELKVIEKRIYKMIDNLNIVGVKTNKDKNINGVEEKIFLEQQKSLYDSINDTMKYADALKRAVQQSNAITTVEINNKKYTVAEAISMKNNGIEKRQLLLDRMNHLYKSSINKVMESNNTLQAKADNYLSSMGIIKDVKNASEEEKKIRENYIEINSLVIVTPINIVEDIENISKSIDDFIVDVDSKLSTSNAITNITIEW